VTATVWLMFLAAFAWLAGAVVAALTHSHLVEIYQRLYAGDPQLEDTEGASAVAATALQVGLGVVFGAGLIVLAAFIARGANVARIIAWVVTGLGVCCAGYNTIGVLVSNAMGSSMGTVAGIDMDELNRLQDELMPSWYEPALLTLGAIQILTLIVVVVLLLLPPANAYFRRQQPPPWEPPVPSYPPVNPPPQ
jgi:hypothetical protein